VNTNCYRNRGATDIEGGGRSLGRMSLEACKEACLATAHLSGCDAITVSQGASNVYCYRRKDVVLDRCVQGRGGYDTHLYELAPVLLSPPPPSPSPPPTAVLEWLSPGGGPQGACRTQVCEMPPSSPVQCYGRNSDGCYDGCSPPASLCRGVEEACSLGAFTSHATDSQSECQRLCADTQACRAYEYSLTTVGSGKRCELHFAAVSHTAVRNSAFRCYMKPV